MCISNINIQIEYRIMLSAILFIMYTLLKWSACNVAFQYWNEKTYISTLPEIMSYDGLDVSTPFDGVGNYVYPPWIPGNRSSTSRKKREVKKGP